MQNKNTSPDRRSFVRTAGIGAGASAMWAANSTVGTSSEAEGGANKSARLPREVWVATVTQDGLRASDTKSMCAQMLARMEEVAALEPDIICLPELFPFANLTGPQASVEDQAETPIGDISRPFAEFAAKHHCYVVCPTVTTENGRFYNSAVFIDRQGELLGEYRKVYPTKGEMERGISPGPLDPPVFKTDFGIVGAQICFDIEWVESWQKLRQAGAEIVFWPSAFAGGSMVNTKAWQNKYCLVSSTRKDTSKICDVTGEEVAKTSRWNHWACAPLNLEKAFLHTWPFVQRFDEIHAKYGRKVRIRNFAEEEWSILESRSPDVKVADIMKEFELLTLEEHIQSADAAQCQCR